MISVLEKNRFKSSKPKFGKLAFIKQYQHCFQLRCLLNSQIYSVLKLHLVSWIFLLFTTYANIPMLKLLEIG